MPRVFFRTMQVAMLLLPLAACGDPLRLVLVEAGGSNALVQGGSDSGGSGGAAAGGTSGTPELPKPCDVAAAADAPWNAEALYTASYVSALHPGQYIRHIDSLGFIGPIDPTVVADKEGASFEVIPGVWDCECISLRAINQTGALLRHAGSRVYMNPAIDQPLYLNDASFCPEPGLADPEGVSFRSVNYQQRMIHLRNQNELWIDDIVRSPPATAEEAVLFASEVTFYRETALVER